MDATSRARLPSAAEAALAGDLASSAGELLAALPAEQLAACRFAADDARRLRWNGGPDPRDGVQLREMAPAARHLAIALAAAAHSPRGLRVVLGTMSLEAVLDAIEGGRRGRHPDRYWLQVFGDPGAARWMARLEGHHCSINVAVADGRVRATPLWRATNPARVPDGPRAGLRVLGREEDAGIAAMRALGDAERARADGSPLTMDILTGAAALIDALPPGGVALGELSAPARSAVDAAIEAWFAHLHPTVAAAWRARLEPRRDALRFALAGEPRVGSPHAWRVVGAGCVLECNVAQNAGNHVHAILREPDEDFAWR